MTGHQETAGTAVEKASRTLELVRKGKWGAERFGIFEEGLWNDVKWMKECLHGGGRNGKWHKRDLLCVNCYWKTCLSDQVLAWSLLSVLFLTKTFLRAPLCNLTVQPTCESHSHCTPSEKATGLQGCHQQQLLLTPPDNSSVISDLSPTSLTSSDTVLPSNLQAHT